MWLIEHGVDSRMDRLTCDQEPTQDQISEYQQWLEKARWYTRSSNQSENEDWEDGGPPYGNFNPHCPRGR